MPKTLTSSSKRAALKSAFNQSSENFTFIHAIHLGRMHDLRQLGVLAFHDEAGTAASVFLAHEIEVRKRHRAVEVCGLVISLKRWHEKGEEAEHHGEINVEEHAEVAEAAQARA